VVHELEIVLDNYAAGNHPKVVPIIGKQAIGPGVSPCLTYAQAGNQTTE
jgi:hypothetical protein